MDSTINARAIDVQNLSRIYETTIGVLRRTRRQILALDNVSFSIPPGELFGLVEPNGAGKTTLIKVLSTLLLPTNGILFLKATVACRECQPPHHP